MQDQLFHEITEQVIEGIEAGADDWEMPWHKSLGAPFNSQSGHIYSGINMLALWLAQDRKGYDSCQWATYNQWKELEGQVKKGEKGTRVLRPVFGDGDANQPKVDASNQLGGLRGFRLYSVFNEGQTEGYEDRWPPIPIEVAERNETVESYVHWSGANVRHGGERALYTITDDFIQLPDRSRFGATKTSSATEAYYATLLHELVHWTGHESRVGRPMAARGTEKYASEELIAELGAAFLCAVLDVTPDLRKDHVSYIQSWLKLLRNDHTAIVVAAAGGATAVRYLNNFQPGAEKGQWLPPWEQRRRESLSQSLEN